MGPICDVSLDGRVRFIDFVIMMPEKVRKSRVVAQVIVTRVNV